MKVIYASGISGVDKKGYCDRNIKYSEGRGKRIEVCNIGSMMIQHSSDIGRPLNPKNILHADKAYLAALRSAVFMQVANDIYTRMTDREQWPREKLSYTQILYWQNIDVESTSSLANTKRKPFFALPTG